MSFFEFLLIVLFSMFLLFFIIPMIVGIMIRVKLFNIIRKFWFKWVDYWLML